MSDRSAATSAVLDEMVAGIMGVKADKAAELTPVGMEKRGPLSGPHATAFPFDQGDTVVQAIFEARRHIKSIREELDHVVAGLDALDALYGGGVQAEVKPKAASITETARQVEPFPERMDRLAREAQAATFAAKDDEPVADGWSDWKCPTHGDDDIRRAQSPRGRKYNACAVPDCKEFEKK